MQSFLTRASIKTLEVPHSCTQVYKLAEKLVHFISVFIRNNIADIKWKVNEAGS